MLVEQAKQLSAEQSDGTLGGETAKKRNGLFRLVNEDQLKRQQTPDKTEVDDADRTATRMQLAGAEGRGRFHGTAL